ncbi:MAG: class I SAM-dependent methyltransferase [Steroidobacteraceae bacterium]|jgi:SAM-dependent MidA family methyltransferase
MTHLPAPQPEALAHSLRLSERIAERLALARGWISFAEYMRLALYEPGLGYYSAGASKFGDAGDFVTAPEISPLFAEVVAGQMDLVLRTTGSGDVLELGPGTGAFAFDAIGTFHRLGTPIDRYRLLEVSADLRERQALRLDRLAQANPPRDWCDRLPEAFSGVIFGNEVIDALPCERFVVRDGQWWRLGVGLVASASEVPQFEWRIRPADGSAPGDEEFRAEAALLQASLREHAIELPPDYCGEWQLGLDAWLQSLASSLTEGVILLSDYGLPRAQLYHPDRAHGSLRGYYRHHAHDDPFLWPGLSDITAWVDFTRVAEAAERAGLQVLGFTTQMGFLAGGGVDQAMSRALDEASSAPAGVSVAEQAKLAGGLRRLLMPGEMGESVKFLMLSRSERFDLPAFAFRDLRHTL